MSKPTTFLAHALLALSLPFASFASEPTPTTITAVSGGGQWTPEATFYTNPLVAQVTDASNNPIPGAIVNFSGPGIVSTSTTTDIHGDATVSVKASITPGGNTH